MAQNKSLLSFIAYLLIHFVSINCAEQTDDKASSNSAHKMTVSISKVDPHTRKIDVLSIPIVSIAQPEKKINVKKPLYGKTLTEQALSVTGRSDTTSVVYLIDPTSIDWDQNPLPTSQPKSFIKITNDTFLLTGDNVDRADTFLIQNGLCDHMMKAAEQSNKKCCFIHVKKNGQDYYYKVNQDALKNAQQSKPAIFERIDEPQPKDPAKPVKSVKIDQPEPKLAPVKPITPDQFKLPNPHIQSNSTIEDLQPKDTKKSEENRRNTLKQISEQQSEQQQKELDQVIVQQKENSARAKKEADLAYQTTLEEKLAQQKQENKNTIKGLNLYFQNQYLEKIKETLAEMPEKEFPQHIDITADLAKLNDQLKEINSPEIEEHKYRQMLFEKHLAKYASWDIEQFNSYNKALEANGLPPVTYKHFHDNVCAFKIKKNADVGSEMDRFTAIGEETERHLELIKKLDKETRETQDVTDNLFKAKIFGDIKETAEDIVLIEGLSTAALVLVSLVPNPEAENAIKSLKKENQQLDTILEQKKEIFDLHQEEAELESRKIQRALGMQMQANQKMMDKITKKKKTSDEQISDLQKQLQEQGNKYVQKQK